MRKVIEAYKCKQPMIEKRHDLLKNVQDAAPVFLKNIGRIEALLLVDYVVLIVHALIEREVRRAMGAQGIKELPLYPERRRCQAPTADRILEVFDGLQRHSLTTQDDQPIQTFNPEFTQLQRRILQLLDVPTKSFLIS